MIDYGTFNVLGIPIAAVDYEAATERIIQAALEGRPLAVSALAVHGLMTGVLDREHRYRLRHFDMLVPDGQPVRWALRWLHGVYLPDRVYGPTLMLRVCERAARLGLPIYLFGATSEILEALCDRLHRRFPQLRIAGTQPSRFRQLSPAEAEELVRQIRKSGAALTFVGLGCPRQEVWAYEFRDALSMPVLAVGAAFAFHAGLLKQAPPSWQRRGLEWLYRLIQEPRRLWKRYVLLNPLYLTLILAQRLGMWPVSVECDGQPPQRRLYG
jgi:N-acetylglucosaminyldiphosphoundecaprenol N-acetyl-beta-D-mannosaminyltransferase